MGPLSARIGHVIVSAPTQARAWWRAGLRVPAPREAIVAANSADALHSLRACVVRGAIYLEECDATVANTECVPTCDVVVRSFRFPPASKREHAAMLELALEASFPCDVSELTIRSVEVSDGLFAVIAIRRDILAGCSVPEPAVWARAIARRSEAEVDAALIVEERRTRLLVAVRGIPVAVESSTAVGTALVAWAHARVRHIADELKMEVALPAFVDIDPLAKSRACAELAAEGIFAFEAPAELPRRARWGWALVALVALIGAISLAVAELDARAERVAIAEAGLAAVREDAADITRMQQALLLRDAQEDRALDVVASFGRAIPRGMHLQRLSYRDGEPIAAEGVAQSASQVLGAVEALASDGTLWKRVWVDRMQSVDGDRGGVRFQLSGMLR